MMRIVVTGKSGQVATALAEKAAERGVTLIAVGRPEFDLAHADQGMDAIVAARPDVIVSAAAYTAVDKAESDVDMASAVNASGPAALGQFAAQLRVPIVHLSTDYVFDGSKSEPYVESDPTNPLGVYGATKLVGEHAVALATANHAILRTAWVYSPFGANFLKTMLRVGAERPQLRVVDDQVGNPTSALDIADAVLTVAQNLHVRPDESDLRGIFHMTGSGEGSWADFATEIFAASRALGGPNAEVARITTADYPTPARRPANSRLRCDRLAHIHGIVMPAWQTSTRTAVARLVGQPA
jgi:dTDP-4-dehydrorhamnose reductase